MNTQVQKQNPLTNPTILFAAGAFLASLSCFSRADYNLPLFAFLAVMWHENDVSLTLDPVT